MLAVAPPENPPLSPRKSCFEWAPPLPRPRPHANDPWPPPPNNPASVADWGFLLVHSTPASCLSLVNRRRLPPQSTSIPSSTWAMKGGYYLPLFGYITGFHVRHAHSRPRQQHAPHVRRLGRRRPHTATNPPIGFFFFFPEKSPPTPAKPSKIVNRIVTRRLYPRILLTAGTLRQRSALTSQVCPTRQRNRNPCRRRSTKSPLRPQRPVMLAAAPIALPSALLLTAFHRPAPWPRSPPNSLSSVWLSPTPP